MAEHSEDPRKMWSTLADPQLGDRKQRVREWVVVGGLLVIGSEGGGGSEEILLVANRRRGGAVEWTPPGGVVDPGEVPLDALTREVAEETGLEVDGWTGPCYRVRVDFPDREMTLDVVVHRAVSWSGVMSFDDPDGIVEDARFVDVGEVDALVATAPAWVSEPLGAWLVDPVRDRCDEHDFIARGLRAEDLVVERVVDQPGT